MQFSLSWLKDYVDIQEKPEKLAELLVRHSFEIEEIRKIENCLNKIVVGLVLKTEKHPNADKLKVCKVDISGKKILQIICGASNVSEGQKVFVALKGSILPGGLKIEKRELRGVVSEGMICSAKELGLEDESDGILVLDDKVKTGQAIKEVLVLDDVLFDIDILPNRAHDCLSYIGMAKEIGILVNKKVKNPLEKISFKKEVVLKTEDFVKVEVKDTDLCPRYMAQVIKDVKISSSPLWLQSRLRSVGVKCINNVVDITNFVMLETGQPMHAFDSKKLGKNIIVRKAKKGEKFLALDGKVYDFEENDLVIADKEKPIALAGIIGGEESSVSEDTSIIVLEAANFDYKNIRKTSRRLNIFTDSSDRFSKNIDENLAEEAMKRAISLIQEYAGGKVAKNWIDIYPVKSKSEKISISVVDIQKISGTDIKEKDIISILKKGNYKFKKLKDVFEVEIPTVRKDLVIMQDLVEEIIRIYGYDNIVEKMPKEEIGFTEENKVLDLEYKLKDALWAKGFAEVYNYSFIEKSLFDKELLEIANPMQKNQKFLRDSLINNILKNVNHNLKFYDSFRIYELAKVFHKNKDSKGLPKEEKMLCGAIVLSKDKKGETFFTAKGVLESLNNVLKSGFQLELVAQKENVSIYHPCRLLNIKKNKESIGICGEVHPNILKEFDIEKRVVIFDISFDKLLLLLEKESVCFNPIVKFPKVELDLSLVVDKKKLWLDIENVVLKTGNNLVKDVKLFDCYESNEIGENKKSLAFHIIYQANDRTLTSEEVKVVHDKIIDALRKNGAEVRM